MRNLDGLLVDRCWDNWSDEDADPDAEADEEMDAGHAPRPVCGLF